MININEIKELLPYCRSINILFVEDNEIVRNQTLKMLGKIFPNITSVNNGQEAIDKYNSFKNQNDKFHDIVMTDLSMPVLNGNELCKLILKKNPKQQIVILSAHTESDEFEELKKLNISNFIQKPINQDELLSTLIEVIKELKNSSI